MLWSRHVPCKGSYYASSGKAWYVHGRGSEQGSQLTSQAQVEGGGSVHACCVSRPVPPTTVIESHGLHNDGSASAPVPAPAAAEGDSAREARRLTGRLSAARSEQELHAAVEHHSNQLNPIHVAAALGKLVKLRAIPQEGPNSASARQQPGASSSSSGSSSSSVSSNSGSRTAPGRRLRPSAGSSNPADSMHAAASAATPEVEAAPISTLNSGASGSDLANKLGSLFLGYVAEGAYEAGQLQAGFTSLGRLQYGPSEEYISHVLDRLADAESGRLREGSARHLARLAHGLARLRHANPHVWSLFTTRLSTHLPELSAGDLSKLAWASAASSAHHSHSGSLHPRQPHDQLRSLPAMSSRLAIPEASSIGYPKQADQPPMQQHLLKSPSPYTVLVSHISEHVLTFRQLTDFKPFQLVLILWACAKVGCNNGMFIDAVATHLFHLLPPATSSQLSSEQLQQRRQEAMVADYRATSNSNSSSSSCNTCLLSIQDISMTSWALAKLNHRHPQLMDALSAAALQLPELQSQSQASPPRTQEMCNMLWAMASLQQPDEALCGVLFSKLMQQATVGTLAPQTLSNATWAAATLRGLCPCPPPFAEIMLSAALPQLHSFKPNELANLVWALAALGHRMEEKDLWKIHVEVRAVVAAMQPAGLAQVAWAGGPLTSLAVPRTSSSSSSSSSQDSSNCSSQTYLLDSSYLRHVPDYQGSCSEPPPSHLEGDEQFMDEGGLSFSRWNNPGRKMVRMAGMAALGVMPQFQAQELAVLARCLTDQQEADRDIFRAIEVAAIPQIGSFTPEGLSNLLWAFARSKKRPQQLISSAVAVAASRLHHFTLLELSTLLWSLATMQHRDKELLDLASQLITSGGWALPQAGVTQPLATLHPVSTAERSICRSSSTFSTAEENSPKEHASHMEDVSRAARSTAPQAHLDSSPSGSCSTGRGYLKDLGRRYVAGCPNYGLGHGWATLAQAFSNSGYHQSQLYDCLAEGVLPHLANLDSYLLPRLLWAFATHRHRHERLMHAVAQVMTERLWAAEMQRRSRSNRARGSRRSSRSSASGSLSDYSSSHRGSSNRYGISSMQQSNTRSSARAADLGSREAGSGVTLGEAPHAAVQQQAIGRSSVKDDALGKRIENEQQAGTRSNHAPVQADEPASRALLPADGTFGAEDSLSPARSIPSTGVNTEYASELERGGIRISWEPAEAFSVGPIAPVLMNIRPTGVSLLVAAYAKLQLESMELFDAVFVWSIAHQADFNLESWSRLTSSYSTLCHPAEGALFERLSQLHRLERMRKQQRKTGRRNRSISGTGDLQLKEGEGMQGGSGSNSQGGIRAADPKWQQHMKQAGLRLGKERNASAEKRLEHQLPRQRQQNKPGEQQLPKEQQEWSQSSSQERKPRQPGHAARGSDTFPGATNFLKPQYPSPMADVPDQLQVGMVSAQGPRPSSSDDSQPCEHRTGTANGAAVLPTSSHSVVVS